MLSSLGPAMPGCARRWRRVGRGPGCSFSKRRRSTSAAATAGLPRARCGLSINGVDDLLKLCDLSETELATSDFGTYTTDQYYDDLGRLTDYRSNPDMAELLVTKSQETLLWMRSQGIRFAPMYSRQAFKHEGKFVFLANYGDSLIKLGSVPASLNKLSP
jgi:hypothetical protein